MSAMKMSWLLGVLALVLAPVAIVSATVITDDFNRADAANLGPNWAAAFSSTTQFRTEGNTAAYGSGVYGASSYYTAALANGTPRVTMSVDFEANNSAYNVAAPGLWMGIGYTGAGAGAPTETNGSLLIQGTVGMKFWVDGDWRDTTSAIALTAGTWYRATVDQNGADFTGTLSTLTGTILKQDTYHSLVKTSSTGAAYIHNGGIDPAWYGVGAVTAFDNFSLTLVPEPSAVMLLSSAMIGLLCYAWRKRR